MASPSPLPRWSLAGLALLHGAVLAAAASVLPWRPGAPFAALTTVLALAHFVTAALAVVGSPRRALAWRITSLAALLFLAYHTWLLVDAATYIAVLYGGLGEGVAAGVAAAWAVIVLFTVPLAAWGIAATGGIRQRGVVATTAAGLAILVGAGLWRTAAAADDRPVTRPEPAAFEATLTAVVDALPPPLTAEPRPSLFERAPARCDASPADGLATVVVTYLRKTSPPDPEPHRVATRCIQAAPQELEPALREALADAAARAPLKVDLVTSSTPLTSNLAAPDAFALRPGTDGVCRKGRCLMPWQMVALDQFVANTPLEFIGDFRFGVTTDRLARALTGRPREPDAEALPLDGLDRITTRSFMVDPHLGLREIPRGRDPERPLTARTLRESIDLAERYILASQADDGRFRYILDPHTGRVSWQGFAVPRQAGTTLALCEVGSPSEATRAAVRRSLKMLASIERRSGDLGALAVQYGDKPPKFAPLGNTALSMIAFMACRPLVGDEFDATIARLGRFLLTMQRPDGGFYPGFDLAKGEVIEGPDPLYAGGQAVFALTLLEAAVIPSPPPAPFPPRAELQDAVERAMHYTSTRYWNHGLTDFFYLEENWHCLAARASTGHHRHDGYERFCLDYVEFKSRLIYDDESRVDPDYLGAYGFGNVIPPVNTPAAGYGEALAAAMAIREVRGEARPEDHARMASVLHFLVRQQWRREDCFACHPKVDVAGAWSESFAAPEIRIDYVQHAMAALGHGGRFLTLPEG